MMYIFIANNVKEKIIHSISSCADSTQESKLQKIL